MLTELHVTKIETKKVSEGRNIKVEISEIYYMEIRVSFLDSLIEITEY